MWLLVEVESMFDVGKDEKKRYLIAEGTVELKRNIAFLDAVDITAIGTEVHPATDNDR